MHPAVTFSCIVLRGEDIRKVSINLLSTILEQWLCTCIAYKRAVQKGIPPKSLVQLTCLGWHCNMEYSEQLKHAESVVYLFCSFFKQCFLGYRLEYHILGVKFTTDFSFPPSPTWAFFVCMYFFVCLFFCFFFGRKKNEHLIKISNCLNSMYDIKSVVLF